MRLKAPVNPLPLATSKVSVPAAVLMVDAADNVTAPAIVFEPDALTIAPLPPTPVPATLIASEIVISPERDKVASAAMTVLPTVEPNALLWLAAIVPASI